MAPGVSITAVGVYFYCGVSGFTTTCLGPNGACNDVIIIIIIDLSRLFHSLALDLKHKWLHGHKELLPLLFWTVANFTRMVLVGLKRKKRCLCIFLIIIYM